METGDEVTTTLGGRLVRGTVLYVRDGSVRIDVPGRKPITRPIARVKLVRVKALMPTVVQFANAAVRAGEMDADGYLEAMRTGTIPVDDYEAHNHLNAVFFPPSADEIEALKAKIAEHIEIDRAHRPVPKPPKPLRDAAYLSFVRERQCCARGFGSPCSGQVVAHHHGPRGTGQKTDDYRCVPLCDGHHRGFHGSGTIGLLDRQSLDSAFAGSMRAMLLEWVGTIDGDPVIVDALIEHIREASK